MPVCWADSNELPLWVVFALWG